LEVAVDDTDGDSDGVDELEAENVLEGGNEFETVADEAVAVFESAPVIDVEPDKGVETECGVVALTEPLHDAESDCEPLREMVDVSDDVRCSVCVYVAHRVEPLWFAWVYFGHGTHVDGDTAPSVVLYVFTGQSRHVATLTAPVAELYDPAKHDGHDACASFSLYVPGPHSLHDV
jgi:hypothetical protein